MRCLAVAVITVEVFPEQLSSQGELLVVKWNHVRFCCVMVSTLDSEIMCL